MKEAKATNPQLLALIERLKRAYKENGAPIWYDLAKRLSAAGRRRCEVNISRINRWTKPGDTVVVPGKVLGAGELDHEVNVAAFAFSKVAVEKITKAGGKALSVESLIEVNPKGSRVKIIG